MDDGDDTRVKDALPETTIEQLRAWFSLPSFQDLEEAGTQVAPPEPSVQQRRQQEIQRKFPDALDLMVICVEAGLSLEAAFTHVAEELGADAGAITEEVGLTTAELAFLGDRRQALENLALRTGTAGMTASTRCAAPDAIRRPPQEEQTPRFLQENGKFRSRRQSLHCKRRKPCSSTPHFRNARNSSSTNCGMGRPWLLQRARNVCR